jgi:hypothetical protein
MIRSRWFGIRQEVVCDRCNSVITYSRTRVCDGCFARPPELMRSHEFLDDWHQKENKYTLCAMCRGPIGVNAFDVCLNCKSKHPDGSHVGLYSPPSGKTTIAKNCLRCGSLQVISRSDDNRLTYRYYRLGDSAASAEPHECADERNLSALQRRCVHDWLEVASTVRNESAESKAAAKKSLQHIPKFLGFDADDIEYIVEGSITYWCRLCSNLWRLTPSRRHLLPREGDPRR